MLVVSRRENESLLIGGSIVVKVLAICGDKVRIGIDAPLDVPVVRDDAKDIEPRKRS